MFRTYGHIEMALGGVALALLVLSTFARRFPQAAWLRPFRNLFPRPDEAQRARIRRRANSHAGAQFILLGLALPLGYGALTMMTFNEFRTIPTTLVLAASALCIVLGALAIAQSRRG